MVYERDPTSLQSHTNYTKVSRLPFSSYGSEDGRRSCRSPKKVSCTFGQLQCQKQAGPEVSGIYNAYPIDRNIQLPLKLHVYKNKSDLPTAFVSSFASEK